MFMWRFWLFNEKFLVLKVISFCSFFLHISESNDTFFCIINYIFSSKWKIYSEFDARVTRNSHGLPIVWVRCLGWRCVIIDFCKIFGLTILLVMLYTGFSQRSWLWYSFTFSWKWELLERSWTTKAWEFALPSGSYSALWLSDWFQFMAFFISLLLLLLATLDLLSSKFSSSFKCFFFLDSYTSYPNRLISFATLFCLCTSYRLISFAQFLLHLSAGCCDCCGVSPWRRHYISD